MSFMKNTYWNCLDRLVHHQILSMNTFTRKHARTDTGTDTCRRAQGGNIRLKIASEEEKSD